MEPLSNQDANSKGVPEIYFLVPFFLAGIFCYWNHRRSRLPPVCSLYLGEVLELYFKGQIHHKMHEIALDIGLVYRLFVPFLWQHHFIICDAALARLILEGDTSRKIEAGDKLERMKVFDKISMNQPSILSKKTHGEGWGEFL
jgi:hypothetical protein